MTNQIEISKEARVVGKNKLLKTSANPEGRLWPYWLVLDVGSNMPMDVYSLPHMSDFGVLYYRHDVVSDAINAAKQEAFQEGARIANEHLPEEYKSWEEVWNRQVALAKDRDTLRAQLESLQSQLAACQKELAEAGKDKNNTMSKPKLYKHIPAPFFMPGDVVYYEGHSLKQPCISTIRSLSWTGSCWTYQVHGCDYNIVEPYLTLMPATKNEVFK